jgi:hypothetical protein
VHSDVRRKVQLYGVGLLWLRFLSEVNFRRLKAGVSRGLTAGFKPEGKD